MEIKYRFSLNGLSYYVFGCVLFLLLLRLLEKWMNCEMTVSVTSYMQYELKAIPVRVLEWIIPLKSESANAKHMLEKMRISYTGRILETEPT